MTQNNVYRGITAWLQAVLDASKSNTLGDWWNARTLECLNLGVELQINGELQMFYSGLDFTKAFFQAAKEGLISQADVDYNSNLLVSIKWRLERELFHVEEVVSVDVEDEEVITFSPTMKDEVSVEEAVEEAAKPKAGRPRKASK